MYDVLYSNTIQKCPLIFYWIYQLQHSVSLHLTASFMKHWLRVRCTSINSLNVLMNSSSHASLIYTNRQSSSRKSRHQKNIGTGIFKLIQLWTLWSYIPWGSYSHEEGPEAMTAYTRGCEHYGGPYAWLLHCLATW